MDVIGDENALPGTDLDKAAALKLGNARRHDGETHAGALDKLALRRQLVADLQLAGENHVFDFLHEDLLEGGRVQFVECHRPFHPFCHGEHITGTFD